MSATEREMAHPNRATRTSPGRGGISMLQGRQGHVHTMWSKVPMSRQPGQMQVSTSKFWALWKAAGEKQPPVATARASGLEAANFRTPSQSILRKTPLSKRSRSRSRRFDWQHRCATQPPTAHAHARKDRLAQCFWAEPGQSNHTPP